MIQNLNAAKNILAGISWKEFSAGNFICSLQTLKNQSWVDLKLLYIGKSTGKMLVCLEMEKLEMKSSSSVSQCGVNVKNYYSEICKNTIA